MVFFLALLSEQRAKLYANWQSCVMGAGDNSFKVAGKYILYTVVCIDLN